MAITRVQTSSVVGGWDSGAVTLSPVFGSNITSGNLIVVLVRAQTQDSACVDTLLTTYTQRETNNGNGDGWISQWSGVAASGGANTVAVTIGATSFRQWAVALEYAPSSGSTWSSPFDTSDDRDENAGATDLYCDAITTAQASEVLVACASQNDGDGTYTYTAGTDFTLINGSLGGGGKTFGGAEEYITSGILSSYSAHITSSINGRMRMLVVAYKDTAAAGRTTKNTRSAPLGMEIGMDWRGEA